MEKTEKFFTKQMKIFFIVNFGLTAVFGILMGILWFRGLDTGPLALCQMLYPAIGVMVAKIMTEEANEIPKSFYTVFLCSSTIIVFVSIIQIILGKGSQGITSIIITFTCFILGMVLLGENKEVAIKNGIRGGILKKSIYVVVLFICLYFCRFILAMGIIDGNIGGEIKEIMNVHVLGELVIIIPLFFISFIPFLGEEYGWRYYLQPAMQKKFGTIKGVISLGFVWGIWHLPVIYFYYSSLHQGIIPLLQQISYCILIGIFLSYAYMKSRSAWTVSMIHYINNGMPLLLGIEVTEMYTKTTWEELGISILIGMITYGIVIFDKEFRKKH